jgi:N utilization substance protein B
MRRRKARELALQLLYEQEFHREVPPERLTQYLLDHTEDAEVRRYAQWLIEGVRKHRPQLDSLIEEGATTWALERIGLIERALLRMALYEMLHGPDVDPATAIDEAVRLAKRYGDAQSPAFVNAVLDALRRKLNLPPVRPAPSGAPNATTIPPSA